jgi:hypothetical protein
MVAAQLVPVEKLIRDGLRRGGDAATGAGWIVILHKLRGDKRRQKESGETDGGGVSHLVGL